MGWRHSLHLRRAPRSPAGFPPHLSKSDCFLCQSSQNKKTGTILFFFSLICFIMSILSIQFSRQGLSFPEDMHVQSSWFCSSHESRKCKYHSPKGRLVAGASKWLHKGIALSSYNKTEFADFCWLTLVDQFYLWYFSLWNSWKHAAFRKKQAFSVMQSYDFRR